MISNQNITMLKSVRSVRFVTKITNLCNNSRLCTTNTCTDDEKEKELKRIAENATIDSPPTSCCQSGCANCVYIAWAEALSAKMKDAKPELAQKILSMVEDPSMKAYLEMELRLRGLKS